MITSIKKHSVKIVLSAALLIGLGAVLYKYNNTHQLQAANPIWAQASEIIQDRLQTKLSITSPIYLIAALAIAFEQNPDDVTTFDDLIKYWIHQGGNINQIFKSGEAYPLFFDPATYAQVDDELKQQPVTIIIAFAGLSTIVATMLKNGALPVIGHTNALDAWAQQYLLLEQQSDDQESLENQNRLRHMLYDALQFLLNASTQDQKNDFFEKYPQFKKEQNN